MQVPFGLAKSVPFKYIFYGHFDTHSLPEMKELSSGQLGMHYKTLPLLNRTLFPEHC